MKAAFPDNNDEDTILDLLLERADLQGHLTMDDLEEIIPQSGGLHERMDEVVVQLSSQGVNVLSSDENRENLVDISELMNDADTDMDPSVGFERVPSEDTISLYLREMSRVPLLNMEQEVDLAQRYEAGKAAMEKLIKLNGNSTEAQRENAPGHDLGLIQGHAQEILQGMVDGVFAQFLARGYGEG